ncbi:hypothetical protein MRB53_029005 [Persea americana]|uniref:Uncharacterized protein n=1 Tax=Persea americana TaxID=3435 RepID=A0ACC2KHB8_PERAE|nr:hypothetical protein MRB53_029005 [Persea americana]
MCEAIYRSGAASTRGLISLEHSILNPSLLCFSNHDYDLLPQSIETQIGIWLGFYNLQSIFVASIHTHLLPVWS